MDMAMIWNLPHHSIDNELACAVLLLRYQGQRVDHELPFYLGRRDTMVAEHGHRRIAGIAIEQREFEGQGKTRVPGSIFLQLAELTFCHGVKA
jgi:hypothetical protein